MQRRLPAFFSELPRVSDYNPIRSAIEKAADPSVASALQLFASMPPSTTVFANPARHRHTVQCNGVPIELSIRSFGIRGCLFEEDIVTGSADAIRVIFVGLFGRFATATEHRAFSRWLAEIFEQAITKVLPKLAEFTKKYPSASPAVAMQYIASIRNATEPHHPVNDSVPPQDLLHALITTHLENVAAGACLGLTRRKVESLLSKDVFATIFSLLLGHPVTKAETKILQTLGSIQIHHGSAGSNMVARYLASLHTRSVSDLFTAAQMTLDCARHFGAISDMTDFVNELEQAAPHTRDERIRQRAMKGSLPTFGHPEIAAAGRGHQIEVDPRPAIYLSPFFEAVDAGALKLSSRQQARIRIVQRMYHIAFVEGIEKPGRDARLRVAPNTDFGAWIVQEALGIDESARTLLSYVFRGFGWMMDVREQLQQPIIRPVIPADPAIVPCAVGDGVIPQIIQSVHDRIAGIPA